MKKHFKRRTFFIITAKIFLVLGILAMIFLAIASSPLILAVSGAITISKISLQIISIIATVLFTIVLCIAMYLVISVLCFPEFDYSIEILEDSININFSKTDIQTISKTFLITKAKTLPIHIVLDDGNTSVELPYNKKVLEFLNQIKN